VTIQKLSPEELAKYRGIRAKRLGKPPVPGVITVDAKQMKNMQGMVPVQLWTDVRMKAAQDNLTVSKLMETALETYLVMELEDFQRIRERYEKALEEEEGGK